MDGGRDLIYRRCRTALWPGRATRGQHDVKCIAPHARHVSVGIITMVLRVGISLDSLTRGRHRVRCRCRGRSIGRGGGRVNRRHLGTCARRN